MGLDRNEAISALYEREYDTLCRAAFRALGDWAAAQDLVQDTFLLALLRADVLPGHPAPGGWLTQTLRNLIQNERRKLAMRRAVPLEDAGNIAAEEPPGRLDELLPPSLGAQERELLCLRFIEQMSYREIGARLGISEGACRVRLFRTVKKCRGEWAQD